MVVWPLVFSAAPASAVDLSQALVLQAPTFVQAITIMPVVWCLVAGALLLLTRNSTRMQPRIAILALVGLLVINGVLLNAVIVDGPVTMVMGRWLPPFGIAFTVDLTGALFATASCVVALLVAVYSVRDTDETRRRYGFYPFLLLLMAGISGAFLTGDIFNLYVWFEVLLIASFGLLVLGSEPQQLDGTLKYAILNLIATTLFLIATGLLYAIFGTLNMADIAMKAKAMEASAPLMTLAMLYLLAFGMKAAAFPVNAWLPASYHTPQIVVAALFAGLLTKVGIYALLRTEIMLLAGQGSLLSPLVAVVAAATMLTGAFGALAQNDIRRLSSYLVIAGIGSILAGLAIGTQHSIAGAITYSLHSILAMSALYLLAGQIFRLSGTWSLTDLGGLMKASPLLAALALVLVFAVAGLPPFSGFWPKVMLVNAALETGHPVLAFALLASGFLTLIALARLFSYAFWRNAPQTSPASLTTPLSKGELAPLLVLAAMIIVIGLYPEPLLVLTQKAAASLIDPSAYVHSVFPDIGQQGATP
jgi:multicomponent Na+:H+ antiporter subunit D